MLQPNHQTCSIEKKKKGISKVSETTAKRKLFLEKFTSLVSQEYGERPRYDEGHETEICSFRIG